MPVCVPYSGGNKTGQLGTLPLRVPALRIRSVTDLVTMVRQLVFITPGLGSNLVIVCVLRIQHL